MLSQHVKIVKPVLGNEVAIQCCKACADYGGPGIKIKIEAQPNHLMPRHLDGQHQLPS